MYSNKYCGSYKIISVTPKRLWKTQFFEKWQLSSEKKMLAFFSRVIENDKPEGTIHKGPQRILTNTGQVIIPFF